MKRNIFFLLGILVVGSMLVIPLSTAQWVPPSLWSYFEGQALRTGDANVSGTLFVDNITSTSVRQQIIYDSGGSVGVILG